MARCFPRATNPRGVIEAPEETEVAGVVADVAQGCMDKTGSTVHENVPVEVEDTCNVNEFMALAGDVAFAGASLAVFAGNAAGAASPADFAKVIAADAVALADADPAGVVTVAVASLADAGKVTVGVASLALLGWRPWPIPEWYPRLNAGKMLPAVSGYFCRYKVC